MQAFLDSGITVILWLFSPTLDMPFKFITFLGEEMFFFILLPFVYWFVDKRLGSRLIVLFLFSAWLNSLAKLIAAQPRPFTYDARIKAIGHAGGGELPSGHTQGSVVVWAYIAAQLKQKRFWLIAIMLMLIIPLSRLYLEVHFPLTCSGATSSDSPYSCFISNLCPGPRRGSGARVSGYL